MSFSEYCRTRKIWTHIHNAYQLNQCILIILILVHLKIWVYFHFCELRFQLPVVLSFAPWPNATGKSRKSRNPQSKQSKKFCKRWKILHWRKCSNFKLCSVHNQCPSLPTRRSAYSLGASRRLNKVNLLQGTGHTGGTGDWFEALKDLRFLKEGGRERGGRFDPWDSRRGEEGDHHS